MVRSPKYTKSINLAFPCDQPEKVEFTFLIAILFFVHLWVNVAATLDLFLNVFVSNVYSWSTKLLQIRRIIFSMFSGIIIVTINISKWRTY